jgi:CubicO group peptidase (beta-lactamase class C family)
MQRLAAIFLVLAANMSTSAMALDRSRLESLHKDSGLPGLCVASFDLSGTRDTAAFGWVDIAAQVPYTAETIQPVGSISKTVIGLVLANLSLRGVVDLDAAVDPPSGYHLRNPRHPAMAITWRQLATHTSSIVDDPKMYLQAYEPGAQAKTSMTEFVARYFSGDRKGLTRRYAKSAPGTAYLYSNMGAAVAAVALEAKLDTNFEQATKRLIFEPTGMAATSWRFDSSLGNRNATLYEFKGGTNTALANYSLATYADGGMRTSCAELARYASAILRAHAGQPSPLTNEAVRLMLTPQFTAAKIPKGLPENQPNQGLFWQVRRNGSIGHSGGDPGLSAFLALDVATHRGRLFIANGDLEERPAARQAFQAIWELLAE